MKKLILTVLFLIPVSAFVVLFYIRYEEGTEHERLVAEFTVRETQLEGEIRRLKHELLLERGELSRREAQLFLSRDRVASLEGYIEERADNPEVKIAYITIDDGPSLLTSEILDILIQKNVPATFFVVGNEDPEWGHYYKRIVDEGHPLGNHSFHHDYSELYSGTEAFWEDVDLQEEFLSGFTNTPIKLFRFPGGSNNPQPLKYGGGNDLMRTLKSELSDKGYVYHDWNVFPDDVGEEIKSADELFDKMRQQIDYRKNVTILLHDHPWNVTTPVALGRIIDYLTDEGYCILPLSERSVPVRF